MINKNKYTYIFLIAFFIFLFMRPILVSAMTFSLVEPEKYLSGVNLFSSKKNIQEIRVDFKKFPESEDLGDGYFFDNSNIYKIHGYRSWWSCSDCLSSGYSKGDYGVHKCVENAEFYIQAELYDYQNKLIGTKINSNERISFNVNNKIRKVYSCRVRLLIGNSNIKIPRTTWSELTYGTNCYSTAFREKPIKVKIISPSHFIIKSKKIKGVKYYKVYVYDTLKKDEITGKEKKVINGKKIKPGKSLTVKKRPRWINKKVAYWTIIYTPVYQNNQSKLCEYPEKFICIFQIKRKLKQR